MVIGKTRSQLIVTIAIELDDLSEAEDFFDAMAMFEAMALRALRRGEKAEITSHFELKAGDLREKLGSSEVIWEQAQRLGLCTSLDIANYGRKLLNFEFRD